MKGHKNIMRLLSLFSGIGAFEKALKNIGIDYELVKETLLKIKEAWKENKKELEYKVFDCSKQDYYTKKII